MRFLRAARFRLRAFFDRSAMDDELDLELRDHLEREIRANRSRGLSEHEARRAAFAAFGGVQRYREEARDVRGTRWLDDGWQDVRYALRSLRRTPGFTAVAVLTLALGVGANGAVFTVINGVLLQPLPYAEPDRLFLASYLPTDLPFELPPGLPDGFYLTYRERVRAFERVAGYQRSQVTLSGVGDAVRLTSARVGADFFDVLGVMPLRGRPFTRDEEEPGGDRVAILSDGLWRDRFGRDPDAVGRTITLDGAPHTVVGVGPPDLAFPASAEIWTPLAIRLDPGNSFIFSVVGRLGRGATEEQARRELESVGAALPADPRAGGRTSVAAIIPLQDVLTSRIETSLLIFAGAVAVVLLIAGTNLANLLLIRASARRQELAVRVALGAGRSRIIRQMLVESVLVAALGAAVAMLIAQTGVRALVALAPAGRIPRLEEVQVDAWVLAFTVVICLVTGVLCGLGPALERSRPGSDQVLMQGTRTIGGPQGRIRGVFVIAQIALALVLLTGAGLMIKSFLRMRSADTGYDATGVVTMAVDLPRFSYPDAGRVRQFHGEMLERLERIPGVREAGAISFRPMAGVGIMGNFTVDGETPLPTGYSVDKPTVSPGYFAAMGIRVLRGRDFTARDDAGAPGVVIVSETVAARVWPNDDAVGKRISMRDRPSAGDWLTVIGVVNDIVQDGTMRRRSTIYLPYLQTNALPFIDHMTYVVRSDLGAASVAPAMRATLRAVDPAVPAQAFQTMDESMLDVIAEPLFQTRLLTAFSLLAMLLAAIGTYGVLAYDVTERTREIGIRMALGAESARVVRMVLGRTLVLAGFGVAIGSVGALATTRVLSRYLYAVSATDPATFVATAGLLAAVALVAGLVPSRRASRVDPMIALRNE